MKSLGALLQIPIEYTNDKNPCDAFIDDFKNSINKERGDNGWKYKKGEKWYKQKPITFMAVKMKLYAIRNNKDALESFFKDCKDCQHRYGSFSSRFFKQTQLNKIQ